MFEVSPRPRPAPLTLMLAVMFLAGCAPNRTVMILAADNTVVEPDDAGVLLPQLENPYVVGGDEYDPVAGKVTYPTTKNVVSNRCASTRAFAARSARCSSKCTLAALHAEWCPVLPEQLQGRSAERRARDVKLLRMTSAQATAICAE